MAIGIGDKTYRANNITQSNGSAFLNSGSSLDFMKRTKINLRIKADLKPNHNLYDFNEIFNLYFKFASIIMDDWSPNSAEAVKILMETEFGNQKLIAKKIGINQDAVSKRLKRANIDELLELEQLFEQQVILL